MKKVNVRHPFKGDDFLTRHHLVPKEISRDDSPSNLLRLWWSRHNAWHKMFKQRTLDQVIELLKSSGPTVKFVYQSPQWKVVFKDKTTHRALQVLTRIKQRKKNAF